MVDMVENSPYCKNESVISTMQIVALVAIKLQIIISIIDPCIW